MVFGFTNDDAKFQAVADWFDAAIADGWLAEQTYKHEPLERAARLRRDGFTAQILRRSEANGRKPGKWKYEAMVSLWGPDRLAINPPFPYDMTAIIAGLRTCNACGATDVETQRYSFAGRCCAECRPEMARKHEYPGWTR